MQVNFIFVICLFTCCNVFTPLLHLNYIVILRYNLVRFDVIENWVM